MDTGRMYSDLPVERQKGIERQKGRRSSSGERRWRHRSRSLSPEDSGRKRDRESDRDRSRDKSRDRKNDRGRSRHDRSRERSRSSSRDREYYRGRRRRERSPDKDYKERKKTTESENSMEVTSIIMIRNMKPSVKKEDISKAIGGSMSFVRDIRVIQKKDGMNGFAFIEFYNVADAVTWMEQSKGVFSVYGDQMDVEYCRQRKGWEPKDGRKDNEGDWTCFKCGTLNFSRRKICMTCDCQRLESDSLHEDVREGRLPKIEDRDGGDSEDGQVPPSNILIFRGLDALTKEESVRAAIEGVSSVPVQDIRLIKDKYTNTSRGFCFVELNSVKEATELLETVQQQYPALFIDGRRAIVGYARQSTAPNSVNANVASAAIAQAKWSMNSMQQAKQQAANSGHKTPGKDYPSTYSYDESSGLYYDSATALYYDPKTQYHYNSETGLYCYYDATKKTYISVDKDGNPLQENSVSSSSSATSTTTTTTTGAKGAKAKKDGGSSKSINAKKKKVPTATLR